VAMATNIEIYTDYSWFQNRK